MEVVGLERRDFRSQGGRGRPCVRVLMNLDEERDGVVLKAGTRRKHFDKLAEVTAHADQITVASG